MKSKELSNAIFWSRRQSSNAKSLTPGKSTNESHLPSRNLINVSGIGGGGLVTQSDSLLQTIEQGKRDLVNKTMINFNNNSQP